MRLVCLSGLLLIAAIHPAGAEPPGGDLLFRAKGCHVCHGLEGRTPLSDNYPKLAGQNVPYLIQQLVDIKRGTRNNGLSSTMRTIMEFVSEAEIVSIARYLGGLPTGDSAATTR